ncbi:DUF6493 family protein [Streptomyces albicerus]|uniref:DUF6493 family protein n=1 Tax=Streptomyces albicerus TaxID=2569859 RepID=UPI00124B7A4C|nr:DUF6493 family protein [Streptomyces albicerus]
MRLVERAEAGDIAGVVRELGALTPDRRAASTAALAARREAMKPDWHRRTEEERVAQLAAELGCRVTPEDAADWLLRHENGGRHNDLPLGGAWLVDVLNLHPVVWRAELVARLDERTTSGANSRYSVLEHLVRDTGCPLPTSDAFIRDWLNSRGTYAQRSEHLLGGAPGANLLERLRADDFTPKLLPSAVTRPGMHLGMGGFRFTRSKTSWSYMMENFRVGVLISLASEGVIDRDTLVRRIFADLVSDPPLGTDAADVLEALALTPAEHASMAPDRVVLVDSLLGRLLQDGTRSETAPPLAFLRALAPTPAENAAVVRGYVALLDGSLPVASYAQEVLTGVDEAGLLEPDVLTEVCERVLLRPEKKLVRAQLTWLDRAVRREPTRTGRILVDMAMAFNHPDLALQERALDVVARHLEAAGDAVLPELRTAAERLSPGLAARATELLGTPQVAVTSQDHVTPQVAVTEPYADDVLPVVPEPRPVPGPIATAIEVAHEVAAVVANDQDVVAFERALDGLVRHAHLDRTALALELKPVMRREPRERIDCTQADLYDVATVVRGDEPRERAVHLGRYYPFSLAGAMLAARLAEAMDVIESGAQPFLLAVPTLATGALDAAVLVERISALDELGVTPAPVDLAQALLRVTPTQDEQVLRAAEALGSDAGRRLARWLREGGLPRQESEPKGWPEHERATPWVSLWIPARPGVVLDPPLPPAAAALVGPYEGVGLYEPLAPFWVAQLPHHREEVMARDYFGNRASQRGWTRALPCVAESGGPAGFAVHMALAFGVTFDRQAERDAAVDALLVLAARGQLDSGLLGRQLETLLRGKWIEANRVSDSLRAAAETGAYGTVWSVLEVALPGLLRDTPIRGAAPLLALATECASRCATKGEIAEVTALAARTGSSQAVKNARLLRDVLR